MKVKKIIDMAQLAKDAQPDEHNLDAGFVQQPGLMAHYGRLHSDALRQQLTAKFLRDKTEAEVYADIKQKHVDAGKKFTEQSLAKDVIVDERYVTAYSNYIVAQTELDAAASAVEVMKQKRDMLTQLAKNNQFEAEMSGARYSGRAAAEDFAARRAAGA